VVQNLSVWYDRQPALKNVSLDVAPGHVLAIIGPSGCGKSTFLRTLNRMLDRAPGVHMQGVVRIGAIDVLDRATDATTLRRQVGMVFQTPNPFPFTIFDNVAYGPRLAGITDVGRLRQLVEQSLKKAALWDEVRGKLRRPALALSGGQQQRLCIARALAVSPEVLLMDEPTAALDPVSTRKIEALIRELSGHYTIVLVTHNLQQAARVSDFTAFFSGGELVEVGPTRKIFTAPDDSRTEDYLTGRSKGSDER
jgi:phosphate transport system ATP-binding protein